MVKVTIDQYTVTIGDFETVTFTKDDDYVVILRENGNHVAFKLASMLPEVRERVESGEIRMANRTPESLSEASGNLSNRSIKKILKGLSNKNSKGSSRKGSSDAKNSSEEEMKENSGHPSSRKGKLSKKKPLSKDSAKFKFNSETPVESKTSDVTEINKSGLSLKATSQESKSLTSQSLLSSQSAPKSGDTSKSSWRSKKSTPSKEELEERAAKVGITKDTAVYDRNMMPVKDPHHDLPTILVKEKMARKEDDLISKGVISQRKKDRIDGRMMLLPPKRDIMDFPYETERRGLLVKNPKKFVNKPFPHIPEEEWNSAARTTMEIFGKHIVSTKMLIAEELMNMVLAKESPTLLKQGLMIPHFRVTTYEKPFIEYQEDPLTKKPEIWVYCHPCEDFPKSYFRHLVTRRIEIWDKYAIPFDVIDPNEDLQSLFAQWQLYMRKNIKNPENLRRGLYDPFNTTITVIGNDLEEVD